MQSNELKKRKTVASKPASGLTRDFFEKLPKTDLHVHLDGSLRLETIWELAKKDKIDLGADSIEELKIAGVDLTDPSTVRSALKVFDDTLEQFKALMDV